MSNRPIEEQEDDLNVIKAIMLKHNWAEVRFMYHNKKLAPYVISFGQPDEIEQLKGVRDSLRAQVKEALDLVQAIDTRATGLTKELEEAKDALGRQRGSQPLYLDGMP